MAESGLKLPGRAMVWRSVGELLAVPAAVMVVCALCGAIYGEWYAASWFLLSSLVTAGSGRILYRMHQDGSDPDQVHAMVIAAAGWLTIAVVGALPFLLSAHLTPLAVLQGYAPADAAYTTSLLNFRNPLHAFFESMSGWTTTGLTMSVHEPSLSHAHLLYRSMMQWVGGAGVIVLALTILHTPGTRSNVSLYLAEARQERLRPSIRGTARMVWKVYLGLTAAMALYLFIATLIVLPDYPVGQALFDAVNHAMTGQSTGGFSVLDDSIAGYDSLGMDLVHIPAMISGAIALPVHYQVLKGRSLGEYASDVQVKVLVALFLVGVPVLSFLLTGTDAVPAPFREGAFQYISALTTTGWQTSAIGDWAPAAVLFIVGGAMITGGSAGATVGGVKLLRGILLVKGAWWEVRRLFLPRSAVPSFDVGNDRLSRNRFEEEVGRAAVFTLAYVLLLAASAAVLTVTVGPEFSLADKIFESATAQGTVGLSSGITGPDMSPIAETLFIVQMWAGRLELIPLLVLTRAMFTGFAPK